MSRAMLGWRAPLQDVGQAYFRPWTHGAEDVQCSMHRILPVLPSIYLSIYLSIYTIMSGAPAIDTRSQNNKAKTEQKVKQAKKQNKCSCACLSLVFPLFCSSPYYTILYKDISTYSQSQWWQPKSTKRPSAQKESSLWLRVSRS